MMKEEDMHIRNKNKKMNEQKKSFQKKYGEKERQFCGMFNTENC